MLQETKISEINKQCLSSFWGIRNIDWVFSPAKRLAEGLMITWKKDMLEVQQIEYGIPSLSVKLKGKREGKQWCLSYIYSPSIYSSKADFWTDLNDLANLIDRHWCLGGDF